MSKEESVQFADAKDVPLFGEMDEIVNVLERDASETQKAIERCIDAIGKKQDELDALYLRRDEVLKALTSAKKIGGETPPPEVTEDESEIAESAEKEE
jgi:hypothetical protein